MLHKEGGEKQKEQLKNKALVQKLDLLERGYNVSLEVLQELELERELVNFEEEFGDLVNYDQINRERRLEERKKAFKKN